VDYNGNEKGYVACEFPAYQFIVAVLYRVFGLHEWVGKLVSILFSIAFPLVDLESSDIAR
jgi:hypothetical protein